MFWDSVGNIMYEHPYLKNFFHYLMLPFSCTLFEDPKPGRKIGFLVPAPYTVLLRSLHTGSALWFARFSAWLKKDFIAHKAIYRSGS